MTIAVVGKEVRIVTPEGQRWALGLDEAAGLLKPKRMDTCDVVVPDGVKYIRSNGARTVWVHQTPPKVHNFRWIRPDSPAPFGPEAAYRDVKIALPYVVVFAMFACDPRGRMQLGGENECFFRNDPVRGPSDDLFYPALLNCSKFHETEGHPLSWICTQYLDLNTLSRIEDDNERVRRSFTSLLSCLFETGFNLSSEHHEECSWFTASRGIDARIDTVEAWERATEEEDDLFATTIPWKPVGLSVQGLADRMLMRGDDRPRRQLAASDLARVVTNHGRQSDNGNDAEGKAS